jgi:protoporphyrinogen oxidase
MIKAGEVSPPAATTFPPAAVVLMSDPAKMGENVTPADPKVAVIAGAGPAGLTAAYELLERTGVKPLVFESDAQVGGISKTVNYKGNRIDIGGHRFFSKSDRVMRWWDRMLPVQGAPSGDRSLDISYRNASRAVSLVAGGPDPERTDAVMLVRSRLSRILYLGKFFDYPVRLNARTVANLGAARIVRIGASYARARAVPIRPERSLEDFLINRFGRQLYRTFFKDYTEKVWGLPCDRISAEWGAQRIKGLSITSAITHALTRRLRGRGGIGQKDVETSLIESFLYPKYGPGQMWERVARIVTDRGGEVRLRHTVVGVVNDDDEIVAARVMDEATGEVRTVRCDYFFSTMPVQDLVDRLERPAPANVREVADGLVYRDFVTVGLLLRRLRLGAAAGAATDGMVPDNWIYIQEPDVKVGRLQIFNNWSPYMVADPGTAWLGLEYFCNAGDELWSLADDVFVKMAMDELDRIGVIDRNDVIDSTILRVPKTYPAYFGAYERFGEIRAYLDGYRNLFLVGRNGMHKYNNQDHSMLTAMIAVDNIVAGVTGKDNLWSVNTEMDYHEERLQRTGKSTG